MGTMSYQTRHCPPTILILIKGVVNQMANTSILNAFERMWQHTVAALNNKSDKSDFTGHTGDSTVHITSTERENWNLAKTNADSAYNLANSKLGSSSEINGGAW